MRKWSVVLAVRKWSVVLAVCLVFAALAGGAAAAQETITLTILSGYSPTTAPQLFEMLRSFEAQYPNVRVDYVQQSGDIVEQALVMHAGGEAADIILTGGIPSVEATGILHYIDDLERLDPWPDRSNVFPLLENLFVSRNGRYGLPFGGDTELMFYNVGHFAEAGLPAPGPDVTFTEFREMLGRLTRDEDGDGEPDRYGFRGIAWGWESWLWSNGGAWVDDEVSPTRIEFDDRAVEAVRYRQALRYVDRLEAPGGESTDLFAQGDVSVAARGMGLL